MALFASAPPPATKEQKANKARSRNPCLTIFTERIFGGKSAAGVGDA
jgi:hypothetical protein